MKKILVPTDFSENAETAVDFAIGLAEKSGAELLLLNVLTVVDTGYSSRNEVFKRYFDELASDMKGRLEKLQESIEIKSTVSVNCLFRTGGIRDVILECALEEKADLIVIGIRGAGKFERILWGSTTTSLMGLAHIPVLAVPKNAVWRGLKNILFTALYSEATDNLFRPVLELAHLENALVHIAVFTDTDNSDIARYLEHGALLNDYKKNLPTKYKNLEFITEHLHGKEFDLAVDEYVIEKRIDLLVMTTHKRSFWENIFNKSMSKQMAYHTGVPLLVIPENI